MSHLISDTFAKALAAALSRALAALGLLAAGQGLAVPALSTLTSRIAAADRQGAVLGLAYLARRWPGAPRRAPGGERASLKDRICPRSAPVF